MNGAGTGITNVSVAGDIVDPNIKLADTLRRFDALVAAYQQILDAEGTRTTRTPVMGF